MLSSVLTRKGLIPRHSFCSLRSGVLAEQADLGWLPRGRVPRPCPATIAEGGCSHAPAGPQATLMAGASHKGCHCLQITEAGKGPRCTAASRPVSGLGEDSGALLDTAPSLFRGAPPLTGLPRSLPDHHRSTNSWLNGPLTVGGSFAVGCLWVGPNCRGG